MSIWEFVREVRAYGLGTAIHNVLFLMVARRYDHLHGWNDGETA
jgi:hypothetical protein